MPHGNAALQQEGANLVDDTGALADQSLTHAVKRLQVELIVFVVHSSLGAAPPRQSPVRHGSRCSVPPSRADVLRRQQPSIVTERPKRRFTCCARADASLHANEARRHVGKSGFQLATRPSDAARSRRAHHLADIDADYGDCSLECLSHGIACWPGTSTAGPSHYRTCGVSSVTAWASASRSYKRKLVTA